jgi:putative peptide zinc metalloprotease protein
MRKTVCTLTAIISCELPGGAQAATAGHHDNVATATTQTDGEHVADFAWGISRQDGGDVVDQLNAAHAVARCTDCSATAVAFQVVLVSGSPQTVVPRNIAEAVNVECIRCEVAAEARQFVRVVDEPVKFTDAGRAVLADVRRQLSALEAQDVSLAELHTAVEAQEARVLTVMRDEVVPKDDAADEPDVLERRLLQDTDLG